MQGLKGLKARLKLPLLRHPVKGGMALEGPHPGRKQAEGDSATSVTVVDAVDERQQFLSPVVIGCEQIRLMVASGHEVEQHDAAPVAVPDLPPEKWTPGYAYFASACCGVM
jgi:hypothetical protein